MLRLKKPSLILKEIVASFLDFGLLSSARQRPSITRWYQQVVEKPSDHFILSGDSMSPQLATVHENSLVTISLLFSIAAAAIFMAAKDLLHFFQ
ncbi:MAG TPA: hypothetical protein VMT20_06270 [Terriglobia bacterium]|nr:hypothetical protein [Terriglobia bacterium]